MDVVVTATVKPTSESVCRSNQNKVKAKPNERSESAVFDSLSAATISQQGKETIHLDHHLYSQMSDTWIKRPSQPQPFINIFVRVNKDDYNQFEFLKNPVPSDKRGNVITVMADTGCQSYRAGIKILPTIGLKQGDPIPVNMKIHAANNKGITILGTISVRLSGKDRDN